MKNPSSNSATKGFLSEGRCGSVFERRNVHSGAICSPGRPPSPHVSCRRRGFEDDPGTTWEELVALDEVLSTANEYLLATVTRGLTP